MNYKEFISNLENIVVKKPKSNDLEDVYNYQVLCIALKLIKYLCGREVIYNVKKYQELIEKYNIEKEVYKLYFKKNNRNVFLRLLVYTVTQKCEISTITKAGKRVYLVEGQVPSDIENKIVKTFIRFIEKDEKSIKKMIRKEKNRVKIKKTKKNGKKIYKIELQEK